MPNFEIEVAPAEGSLAAVAKGKDRREALPHMPQLDALRAIAVLGVMAFHFLGGVLGPITQYGAYGVALFFVLSGFLISGILFRCRVNALAVGQSRLAAMRQFYFRRALRIIPVCYLALIVAKANGKMSWHELSWHLTFRSNFYFIKRGELIGTVGHFWSLGVEEQFYIVWPWLMLYLPQRWLQTVIMAVICLGPLVRLAMAAGGAPGIVQGVSPFTQLDSLGLGSLLAYRRYGATPVRGRVGLGVAVASLAGIIAARIPYPGFWPQVIHASGDRLAWNLLFFWLVSRASVGFGGPVGWFLNLRPLRYIGTISYGMYVWHLLLWFLLLLPTVSYWRLPSQLPRLVVFPLTIAVAAVSWRCFEKPINDLKRYFPYNGRTELV